MNPKVFREGLATLMRAFATRDFDGQLFWDAWKDLNDGDFLKAVEIFIKSHEQIYPGTNIIASIRKIILEVKYPSVGEAWYESIEAVKDQYSIPTFKNAIVKQAATIIGIHELRTTTNPSTTRAHFFKVYEDLIRSKHEDQTFQIAGEQRKQITQEEEKPTK